MRLALQSLLLALCVAGCDAPYPAAPVPEPEAVAPAQPDARVMRLWARSCALCHVDGNAGAPRIGHADEWRPRLAQGREMLLKHTVEGLNAMPPLGYCMACEREDLLAMIDFMTAGAAAPSPGASP